eukprot:4696062-Amphidinium_carterae.2
MEQGIGDLESWTSMNISGLHTPNLQHPEPEMEGAIRAPLCLLGQKEHFLSIWQVTHHSERRAACRDLTRTWNLNMARAEDDACNSDSRTWEPRKSSSSPDGGAGVGMKEVSLRAQPRTIVRNTVMRKEQA